MTPKSIPSKQIHSQTLNSTIETLQKGVKYSKLTIKTSERRQWCRSGVFIFNFEQISDIFPVLLLTDWNKCLLGK